jgi:hypothetical protein
MTETKGGGADVEVLLTLKSLVSRMDRMEGWMERLGAEIIRLRGDVQQMRTELREEIQQVRTEVQQVHTELRDAVPLLRAEMQDESRQMHVRIDRTNDTMVLLGSEVQRSKVRSEDLDQRMRAILEAR